MRLELTHCSILLERPYELICSLGAQDERDDYDSFMIVLNDVFRFFDDGGKKERGTSCQICFSQPHSRIVSRSRDRFEARSLYLELSKLSLHIARSC